MGHQQSLNALRAEYEKEFQKFAKVSLRLAQVAMYLCREIAQEKLQLIAEKFNKKDHTTVISAIERVGEIMAAEPEVADAVARLRAKLVS